jgi:hypothetical protein
MRRVFAIVLALPLTLAGCGTGPETAPDEVQTMSDEDVHAAAMGESTTESMGGMMGGLNTEIKLDPEIAAAWTGIRVHVVTLDTQDGQIFDVSLGETVVLGDSGLSLTVRTFIPDFVMDETGITSRSAETHNPAARVLISEDGADDYDGWLFAAMPEIHPFPHDRYQVLLIEGIPVK